MSCRGFKYCTFYFAMGCVLLSTRTIAQSWTVPAKTGRLAMGCVVYIESIYPAAKPGGTINDTICGTGVLISNGAKIYVVTAKHLIQAEILKPDQHTANDLLDISASPTSNDQRMGLRGLAQWPVGKPAVLFSSDEDDLAIISLQKASYADAKAQLLKQGRQPLPVALIDGTDRHQVNDRLFHSFFLTYNDNGAKKRNQGLRPAIIKEFDTRSSAFTIGIFFNQANNGSPVFKNDKLIGIVSNEAGIDSNADILNHPYKTATTARVIKASRLIALLKTLQKMESPGH